MDAYSEARQKVFAAAKHNPVAASTKFAAAKVSRSKGPGVQPENTRCSDDTSF